MAVVFPGSSTVAYDLLRRVPLKVVVAVGPLLEREGVYAMLEQLSDVEIVTADDPDADVRIIDAGDALMGVDADGGVIVLGEVANPDVLEALLARSAERRGYLLYDDVRSSGELAAAIRDVAAGGSAIGPRVAAELGGRRSPGRSALIAGLTSRQNAVLAEVATGKSNAAIAASLGITKRAVERHLGAIYPKLGVQDNEDVSPRVAASLLYLRASRGRPSP